MIIISVIIIVRGGKRNILLHREANVTLKAEIGDALGRWRKRPQAIECRWPPEAEKGKEMDSPQSLWKEDSPAVTWTLAPWDAFWTLSLQKSKMIHLCSFQSLHVWLFVITTYCLKRAATARCCKAWRSPRISSCLHFTDGETEVQRHKVSCSRVHCRFSFQIQAWQTSEPRSLLAFKTLVQGSWEPNLSRHPSENVAPRNKAPHLRELLVDTENHPAASVFPFCSPNTPGSSEKNSCPKAPLSGLCSGKADPGFHISEDFKFCLRPAWNLSPFNKIS